LEQEAEIGAAASRQKHLEARLAESEALCDELAVDVAAAEARAEEAEGRVEEAAGRAEEAAGRAEEAEGRVEEAAGRAEEAEGRADREAARLESLLERLMHVHKGVSAARRECEEVYQVRQ